MGRKRVPRYDVTKCFLLHKALILNNLLDSLKHQNVKYVINLKYSILVMLILCQPSSGYEESQIGMTLIEI